MKDVYPITEECLDLAKYIGLPLSLLNPTEIEKRKLSIRKKLSAIGRLDVQCSPFTVLEEFDIHCRANVYVEATVPDPQASTVSSKVAHPGVSCKSYNKKKSNVTDTGTSGQKPKSTLIQLVLEAVFESPDCMLQVGQVYTVLQKKYPYFQHLKRSPLLSWKSSVRHALYQKWFCKVTFLSEFINCHGNYWAYVPDNQCKLPPSIGEILPSKKQSLTVPVEKSEVSQSAATVHDIQEDDDQEVSDVSSASSACPGKSQEGDQSPTVPEPRQWTAGDESSDAEMSEYEFRSPEVKGSLDTTLNELNAISQSTESDDDHDIDNGKGSQTSSESDHYWIPYKVELSNDHTLFDFLPAFNTEEDHLFNFDTCVPCQTEQS